MAKKAQTLIRYLIYLYLIIFPFGKLLKIYFLGFSIDFVDFIIFCIALLTPFASISIKKIPDWLKALLSFLAWSLFSLFIANYLFSIGWQMISFFYFTRLVAYLIFPWAVYISINKSDRKNLIQLMILDILFISVFGWLQYFFYPDLRQLKALGWDDHLSRLVSTFLDPAFTGILLVLGLILGNFTLKNIKLKLIYSAFVFTTMLFTYSRASYFSLLVVIGFILLHKSKKVLIAITGFFLLIILILPRPGGSGAELERVHSIIQKFQNYGQSIELIKSSPLIGYGFNNLCFVKEENLLSHSCFGLDNSFLFVIATTGIIGLMFYFEIARQLLISTAKNIYGQVFVLSIISLLVHTLFTNTLFYNFVLGWMGILVGLSRNSIQNR